MNQEKPYSGPLVKLLHAASEFEAHAKAAVLYEQDIEARVIRDGASWAGMVRISASEEGASIWIRAEDLDAARDALAQNVADSVDLDWDEVDVGAPEEEDTSRGRPGMPIPAKFSFVVTVLMLLLGLLLAAAVLFG